MIDLDTIGYFLFMESQEQEQEEEPKEEDKEAVAGNLKSTQPG